MGREGGVEDDFGGRVGDSCASYLAQRLQVKLSSVQIKKGEGMEGGGGG